MNDSEIAAFCVAQVATSNLILIAMSSSSVDTFGCFAIVASWFCFCRLIFSSFLERLVDRALLLFSSRASFAIYRFKSWRNKTKRSWQDHREPKRRLTTDWRWSNKLFKHLPVCVVKAILYWLRCVRKRLTGSENSQRRFSRIEVCQVRRCLESVKIEHPSQWNLLNRFESCRQRNYQEIMRNDESAIRSSSFVRRPPIEAALNELSDSVRRCFGAWVRGALDSGVAISKNVALFVRQPSNQPRSVVVHWLESKEKH